MEQNELMHYGVLGMKWGMRKAVSKSHQNTKLEKKALRYDKKAAVKSKKSEELHSKNDLGTANKAAKKANVYLKKAAKTQMKSLKTDNESRKLNYEAKAETLKYKAAKKTIDANRISKLKGYGVKAMHESIKSDRCKKKAAQARMFMAKNDKYIALINSRINSLPQENRESAKAYLNKRM